MTFFVDNNLGTALAAGMKGLATDKGNCRQDPATFSFRVLPTGTRFKPLPLD